METKNKCPRCNGEMPLNHAGAISRQDNKTEICSNCGTEEAMAVYLSAKMTEAEIKAIKDISMD